jgi:hypothetical protein
MPFFSNFPIEYDSSDEKASEYQIENRPRGDFEINVVSPELVKKFSKLYDEIDRKTRELLEREPKKAEATLRQ